MELEFDIEALLNKRHIESDRIEFKRGWNPDDIYRSICAFANDFENQGGGYIVIGVEENNGIAIRPVCGLADDMIDKIQKEMLGYNHRLQPLYFPKIIIDKVDGKNVMVIWVPTGVQRPYKTVEHVTSKNDNHYKYFIRYGSSSVVAIPEHERELLAMSAREPFDVQGNENASIDDISPILLVDHLRQTGSKLAKQLEKVGVKEILEQMQLLVGPPERLRVKNVALMMFCDHPDKFFPYMEADIVKFPNGSVKDPNNFIEIPPIKGTVPQIIRKTMEKLQSMVIEETVRKISDRMEADRDVTYPYAALEEAVVNAFYHRDYMSYEPVHIEIEPDCINIISYPGIDRSIPMDVIQKGERFRTRICRNRRLGEFLKELHLTEGKCTGVPTIQEELEKIGSPKAVFYTDNDRRSVCVSIPIRSLDMQNPDIGVKKHDIENGESDIDVEKHDIENGKSDFGVEKHDIESGKSDVDAEKHDIDNGKSDIDVEKHDIDERKLAFMTMIEKSEINKNMTDKLKMLINYLDINMIFSREDVMSVMGCGRNAASHLMQIMNDIGIIEKVMGYGKGKYRVKSIYN